MQVRELAERVLFGRTLAEKLAFPQALEDDRPGLAQEAPQAPGRPRELAMAGGGSKFQMPGLRELEKEAARGHLLHFFANHELLATELMALVLLRFPEAPKAFRRGVVQTLREEQEHTRMYLGRLEKLGVTFGQYPVNGYFWRMVSSMRSPMDYVSRLSLTFEQANLDFSGYYADLFRQVGDSRTEALLRRIHEDEIGHVGYGLKWFRRWKDPQQTDWEAFRDQLRFPLSPSRAKAAPFNRPSRLRAGLDEAFIRELDIFSRSKGRTPDVYWFNPLAETRMGNDSALAAKQAQKTMMEDLEVLPMFLCRRDDVVLVTRKPRIEFLARWKEMGRPLPEFEILRDGRLARDSELRQRKIGVLRPWAWSPESLALLDPLRANLTRPLELEPWEERLRPWYDKSYGAKLLGEFLAQRADREWLCREEEVGVLVHDMATALERVEMIRDRGHARVVAKSLFGLAGQGLLRLWESGMTPEQTAWMERVLRTEGALVIEPWLERVLDFSFQLEMSGRGLRALGLVRMVNDHRGQFQASVFAPRFTRGLDGELTRFAHGSSGNALRHLFADLQAFLEPRLQASSFAGALGVDAFIFRDEQGQLRLKPLVEINPRYTMGRLTLELARRISRDRIARLELINRAQLKKSGHANFADWAAARLQSHPPEVTDGEAPLLQGGSFFLNDPDTAKQVLACWTVGEQS